MNYFVIYFGNIKDDPLDHGTEWYRSWDHAKNFADRMTKKGYYCEIYEGKKLSKEWQPTP